MRLQLSTVKVDQGPFSCSLAIKSWRDSAVQSSPSAATAVSAWLWGHSQSMSAKKKPFYPSPSCHNENQATCPSIFQNLATSLLTLWWHHLCTHPEPSPWKLSMLLSVSYSALGSDFLWRSQKTNVIPKIWKTVKLVISRNGPKLINQLRTQVS